jgi:hypothetical protein
MPTTSAADPRKVIPAIPPLGWRKEIPIYRISRETLPAPKARFRFEPPFSSGSESDVWQFGDRLYRAGEVIESTEWPNPGTMTPLNYSAKQVMEWFTSHQKSRMARSPWANDQVRLDDGLSNPMPKIGLPQLQPMDLRPVKL